MEHCVVVGAGLAGLNAVRALRASGYSGRITLLGAEEHPPYDRPPLSKQLLRGEVDDTALPADWAALAVDARWGVAATGLADDAVETEEGPVGCDGVVLATGSSPVRLSGDGPQHVLRTLSDARRLRAALRPGVRLAIVGAGWIGAEVATTACAAGCEVTVVEAAGSPLATALPADVARYVTPWWSAAGVDLRVDTKVAAVEDGGLRLADGTEIAADEVLSAVGARPATGWLEGSRVSLRADGGVLVNDRLVASDGVCAVGDVAAWPSARYGDTLRVEHWDTALRSPTVAASSLLGGDETYDPVPYVWSEQFGRYTQYVGMPDPSARPVWRGDPSTDPAWSVCWVRDGQIRSVFAVDRPRDATQAKKLTERGQRVDPDKLADPGVAVRQAIVDG